MLESGGKSFGQAMLERMGWRPGGAIGRSPLSVLPAPVEVVPLRARQGLGAGASLPRPPTSALLFRACVIVQGDHQGVQGVVTNQRDGLLEVEINGTCVWLPQHFVQVEGRRVGKNPFARLRKTKADTAPKAPFAYAAGMAVRIRSKQRRAGRLYLMNAVVVDAGEAGLVLRTADNEHIEGVPPHEVEPRAPTAGAAGVVGRGPHQGRRVIVQDCRPHGNLWALDSITLDSFLIPAADVAVIE